MLTGHWRLGLYAKRLNDATKKKKRKPYSCLLLSGAWRRILGHPKFSYKTCLTKKRFEKDSYFLIILEILGSNYITETVNLV